mmetsp:Transcript_32924/g.92211  ORF Transcript_32924/g.92211 Transcript_32924/m.92211 type:complete len:146 (+) Transcript_32924:87-524(+)
MHVVGVTITLVCVVFFTVYVQSFALVEGEQCGNIVCAGNTSCCVGTDPRDSLCCAGDTECCLGQGSDFGNLCCAGDTKCCFGTCCYEEQLCCGAPGVDFGGICCNQTSTTCCPAAQNTETGKKYPWRCCPASKSCCAQGLLGCCD